MPPFCLSRRSPVPVVLGLIVASGAAHAAEHVTLTNGFDLICDHQSSQGDRVRLYMDSGSTNFVELNVGEIASSEHVDLPVAASKGATAHTNNAKLTEAELHQLLASAGSVHDLDVDLLASVVRQESGGNPRAVSRAGAQGLMQLMPGTAADLGVANTFVPGDNISGGTAYLDSLLRRYRDNLALALAAYNAGPAAVDRWHGIPPYRETRAYVARVIHEFNRRVAARQTASAAH
ncbi:MAG: lytic transglycosylase domain-containing protein [Acidobacteriaceae bacterium]|nr:lytic transglycosylase domain-containing protein [Acidobacteriaceae bacterium]